MVSFSDSDSTNNIEEFAAQLASKKNIWVLTGAGLSVASGIPTYRNHRGEWQASQPIQHTEFINDPGSRQKYWARSLFGWNYVNQAKPNSAHYSLAQWQKKGSISQLVTQNVDRLHSIAGAQNVIDLHGRIDQVICLSCESILNRKAFQRQLLDKNPLISSLKTEILPDGDAKVDDIDYAKFEVPCCKNCGGILKPHVVFFGGAVPKQRVEKAFETLSNADCILVIGSSLAVYSGFRFAKWAHQNDLPLYAINQGSMRGSEMFDHILNVPCERALPEILRRIQEGKPNT